MTHHISAEAIAIAIAVRVAMAIMFITFYQWALSFLCVRKCNRDKTTRHTVYRFLWEVFRRCFLWAQRKTEPYMNRVHPWTGHRGSRDKESV
jgi:hypothetical protein